MNGTMRQYFTCCLPRVIIVKLACEIAKATKLERLLETATNRLQTSVVNTANFNSNRARLTRAVLSAVLTPLTILTSLARRRAAANDPWTAALSSDSEPQWRGGGRRR